MEHGEGKKCVKELLAKKEFWSRREVHLLFKEVYCHCTMDDGMFVEE